MHLLLSWQNLIILEDQKYMHCYRLNIIVHSSDIYRSKLQLWGLLFVFLFIQECTYPDCYNNKALFIEILCLYLHCSLNKGKKLQFCFFSKSIYFVLMQQYFLYVCIRKKIKKMRFLHNFLLLGIFYNLYFVLWALFCISYRFVSWPFRYTPVSNTTKKKDDSRNR